MSQCIWYLCGKIKVCHIFNVSFYFLTFIHNSDHSRQGKLIFQLLLVIRYNRVQYVLIVSSIYYTTRMRSYAFRYLDLLKHSIIQGLLFGISFKCMWKIYKATLLIIIYSLVICRILFNYTLLNFYRGIHVCLIT